MPWQEPGATTREARRLHDESGWGYKRIARELGITRSSARDRVNVARRRRLKRQQRARRRERLGITARGRRRRLEWRARRAIIVLLWHDGASLEEIAARLDTTVDAIGARMVAMRKQGYDLPYRLGRK